MGFLIIKKYYILKTLTQYYRNMKLTLKFIHLFNVKQVHLIIELRGIRLSKEGKNKGNVV